MPRRAIRHPWEGAVEGTSPPTRRPAAHALEHLQHTAGNRAVTALVQRWAFIGEKKVSPKLKSLDAVMQAMAADSKVRSYTDMSEFGAHAAGTTDYIGNLANPESEGTWVRFAKKGTNILGENHTYVQLEDVLQAVGSTSFTSEPLSVDDMPAGSHMKAAYETENKDRFKRMGIEGVADKKQFGGESLFPKMGYGLQTLIPYVSGAKKLDELKSGQYVGQPVQRYLKIAWGHAKDLAGKVAAKQKVSGTEESLALVYDVLKDKLDPFITGLPVDGYLGDALDTPGGKPLLKPLEQFSKMFVMTMLEAAGSDARLTATERKQLASMKSGTDVEKMKVFGKWRNLHFSHAVRDAAKRGVRYAGMGYNHLKYLLSEGLPPNSKPYDMQGADIDKFEALTKKLAAKAAKP
jgi:hypothetical protein